MNNPSDYFGINYNMDDDFYHDKAPGVSSTGIKTLLDKSASHFIEKRFFEDQPTAAKNLGKLVHCLILEPDELTNKFIIQPAGWKGLDTYQKAEFLKGGGSRLIMSNNDYKTAQAMKAAALNKKTVNTLLGNDAIVLNETSIFWSDPETEIVLKVRPDSLFFTKPIILDVKTCRSAAIDDIKKDIVNYKYHVSAAMYKDGVSKVLPEFEDAPFVFLFIESSPPYDCRLIELDHVSMERGFELYRRGVDLYADALRNGFPGYPDEIEILTLPKYAFSD